MVAGGLRHVAAEAVTNGAYGRVLIVFRAGMRGGGAPLLCVNAEKGNMIAGFVLRSTGSRYNHHKANRVYEGGRAVAVKVFDIWNEVDEFLTSTPTPQQILAFRPSQAAQERLRHLLDANQSRRRSPDEEAELQETLAVEQFMRHLKVKALAKARA